VNSLPFSVADSLMNKSDILFFSSQLSLTSLQNISSLYFFDKEGKEMG